MWVSETSDYLLLLKKSNLIEIWHFSEIVAHVKSLDTTRPVTIALSRTYGEDKAVSY